MSGHRPGLLRAAWALVAAAVACQIAYPLVEGTARDRLTVTTVVVTFAAVAGHAVFRFGAGVAAASLGLVLAVAAGVETLGVHTGVPFGDYDYGPGLGPELAGVPVVIPAAWAMTAYPALLVARHLTRRHGRRMTALVAGWAVASWDVFLDPQMVEEGYWRWADPDPALPGSPDVPLTNYVGWLVVSVLLMAVLDQVVPDAVQGSPDDGDLLPGVLYLWTYAAQVLGNLAFFDRPAVALLGGLAMGAVAIPYARTLPVLAGART
ncbi:carotenoid biosynthesis protein [Sporichthya sp.]|uniref:carotenoid biosynthesis protein n=1 Tax=Sporichthya sp. TaxID=65475 RepID=UPI0025FCBA97|nr:carotenoid biosynthesis protein [Sporichthya sp.]